MDVLTPKGAYVGALSAVYGPGPEDLRCGGPALRPQGGHLRPRRHPLGHERAVEVATGAHGLRSIDASTRWGSSRSREARAAVTSLPAAVRDLGLAAGLYTHQPREVRHGAHAGARHAGRRDGTGSDGFPAKPDASGLLAVARGDSEYTNGASVLATKFCRMIRRPSCV